MFLFFPQVPVIVNTDYVNEDNIDLLSPNEHITDSEVSVFYISFRMITSLEITVGHHLWKSAFEYNFQLHSWKLYSKTLFHR